MDEERMARIGRNEALFRQVNEQLEAVNLDFATVSQTMVLVCECPDEGCVEQIEMTPREYERLRSDPALFALKPGHEVPDVEDVVRRENGYVVVAKTAGRATEIAEETDPRRAT
jgi:hypothetical protein